MNLISALFFPLFLSPASTPEHTGKCGIIPVKAYSQNVLGRNIGYYVEIKNETEKEVDAIEWEAYFYDNFDEMMEKKNGSWSSGNIIKPCKPDEIVKTLATVWVKEATKVFIKINRVHFTDGSSCGMKKKRTEK
jgi:hypothetical protein